MRRLTLLEDGVRAVGRRGRVLHDHSAAAEHAAAVLAAVDTDAIRAAALHVRVSGGAGEPGSLLLGPLGRPPNGSRPDLVLQLDPDGDRVRLIDERGRVLDAEATLPLTALALDAHDAVKGADTSRMIDDLMAARGGGVRVVTPGELHLVEGLTAGGGDIAGEGNGGVVVPAVGIARDGLAAGAAIMELLARTGLVAVGARRRPAALRAPALDRALRGRDRACAAIDAVAARLDGRARDAPGQPATAIPRQG